MEPSTGVDLRLTAFSERLNQSNQLFSIPLFPYQFFKGIDIEKSKRKGDRSLLLVLQPLHPKLGERWCLFYFYFFFSIFNFFSLMPHWISHGLLMIYFQNLKE